MKQSGQSPVQTTLVAMAGLPGTGKSTLAQSLAQAVGGAVLDKDVIRAALFPQPLLDYSQEQDDFSMEVLFQTAAYIARRRSVPFIFIDGRPFVLRSQMESMVRLADSLGCRLRIIHTICSDQAAQERLMRPHVAANRSFQLYVALRDRFEGIVEPHLTVDTEEPLAACLAQCRKFIEASSG